MKKNIAIVTGGYSSEAVISIKSAEQYKKNINKEKYNFQIINISKDGWFVRTESGELIPVNRSNFSFTNEGQEISFDCALVAIHGTPGEDGKLQGYFELLGIPFTTCDVLTSSLTFNKYMCNKLLNSCGILTAKSIHIKKNVPKEKILNELKLPLFVKPNNGGSSFGVSKVKVEEELEEAIQKALQEDSEIIIEEFIEGKEFTNGVFKRNGNKIVLPVTEIVSPNEFFDYEAKYTGLSDEITPARLSEEQTLQCQAISAQVYEILNCKGVVRIDYILSNDEFYFLEVNTVPGMTEESIIPKQVACFGMEMPEFIDLLIDEALTNK